MRIDKDLKGLKESGSRMGSEESQGSKAEREKEKER